MTKTTDKVKVGDYVRGLILGQKHTPQEIVDLALEKFPTSACDQKHVAWYKWDMKKRGLIPETFDIPSGRKPKKTEAAPKKTEAAPKKAEPAKQAAPRRRRRTAAAR